MSRERGRAAEPVAWNGVRTFIVPPDIIPVRRVSPIPQKKRTLCRPRPDGEAINRSGNREWFSDGVFVECTTRDTRAAYSSSMTVHASCLIGVLVLLSGRPAPAPVRVTSPTPMPAFVAIGGGGGSGAKMTLAAAAPPAAKRVARNSEKPAAVVSKPLDPVPIESKPLAPAEPQIEPVVETPTAAEPIAGTPDGAASSVSPGTPSTGDGRGDGVGSGGTGGAGSGVGTGIGPGNGPYRLGRGIEPPRKIKDVPPVYTSDAMRARVFGTVALEAVVGADGTIGEVKVLRSIPLLDQAAIDCVRKWEFAPARLSGQPVAVIVTILVQFSIR